MKLIMVVLISVLLSGCYEDRTTVEHINSATELCQTHNGYNTIDAASYEVQEIYCGYRCVTNKGTLKYYLNVSCKDGTTLTKRWEK